MGWAVKNAAQLAERLNMNLDLRFESHMNMTLLFVKNYLTTVKFSSKFHQLTYLDLICPKLALALLLYTNTVLLVM